MHLDHRFHQLLGGWGWIGQVRPRISEICARSNIDKGTHQLLFRKRWTTMCGWKWYWANDLWEVRNIYIYTYILSFQRKIEILLKRGCHVEKSCASCSTSYHPWIIKHYRNWPLPGARISQHLNRDFKGRALLLRESTNHIPQTKGDTYEYIRRICNIMVYIHCNTSTDDDGPTHTHPWHLTNGRQFLIMILCKFRTSSSKIPMFIHTFGFPFPVYTNHCSFSTFGGTIFLTVHQTTGLP